MRKRVFGSFDQVRLKLACSATEASMRFEILVTETRDITLSRQRTTKALIRLRGYAGWSAPLLFAYDIRHVFSWPGSIKFLLHGLPVLENKDSREHLLNPMAKSLFLDLVIFGIVFDLNGYFLWLDNLHVALLFCVTVTCVTGIVGSACTSSILMLFIRHRGTCMHLSYNRLRKRGFFSDFQIQLPFYHVPAVIGLPSNIAHEQTQSNRACCVRTLYILCISEGCPCSYY